MQLPPGRTIFVNAYGDISFTPFDVVKKILQVCHANSNRIFYLQTKDPETYLRWFENEEFFNIPDNVILGATVESNVDAFWNRGEEEMQNYDTISHAPSPIERLDAMKEVFKGYQTFITVEPILDFTSSFAEQIKSVGPQFVYVGYCNHNFRKLRLPEPSLEETMLFIEDVKKFTEVRVKTLRKAWYEN
jgi:DNA repair photolyase